METIKFYYRFIEDMLKQHKPALEMKMCDRAIKEACRRGDSGYEAFFKGMRELEQRNRAKALKYRVEAYETDKDNFLFLSGLARSFVGLNKHDKAREYLQRAEEMQPNHPYVLRTSALFLRTSGDPKEAIAKYDICFQLEPWNIDCLIGKSYALQSMAKPDKALECTEEAIRIAPNSPYALTAKGRALAILRKFDDALSCLDEALQIAPGYIFPRGIKGILLVEKGDYTDGLKYLLRLRRKSHYVLRAISLAYYHLHKMPLALRWAQRLRKELLSAGRDTTLANFIIRNAKHATPYADVLLKVLATFQDKQEQYFVQIEKAEQELSAFLSLEKHMWSPRIAFDNRPFLTVLRRWNSLTPAISIRSEESRGGGYFIWTGNQGIIIDPGFNFIHNFLREELRIINVHHIIITHAHLDHTAELESIFSLLHEANENRAAKMLPKKIDVHMNLGSFKKYAGWFDLKADYIERFHVMRPGHAFIIDDFTITPVAAKHNEIIDDIYCLGLLFEKGSNRFGITSDTGWILDGSLGRRYKKCKVIIAHLGSIARKEFNAGLDLPKRFLKNHLGLLGVLALLHTAKPKICVLSEFGEELRNLRGELVKGLDSAFSRIHVLAADIGFDICLSSLSKIRCALCGKFVAIGEMLVGEDEETSTMYYRCASCNQERLIFSKQRRYIERGERSALWREAKASRTSS